MYSYYAIFATDERLEPAGLIVMDAGPGHALLWDHRLRAWAYNPDLAVGFLDDYRNDERQERVDRAAAERIARDITGGEELPDEETIGWVFRWRGRPPQGD
ncbi:hypothetical protein Ais01nite_41070 [Asanoa ishikariensis]|nr:hypothetical protein [Asanoa ishikariensis]GIF66072.1 hypothetical protein Ais01nite_41070 [Asanoa ishikariensis]